MVSGRGYHRYFQRVLTALQGGKANGTDVVILSDSSEDLAAKPCPYPKPRQKRKIPLDGDGEPSLAATRRGAGSSDNRRPSKIARVEQRQGGPNSRGQPVDKSRSPSVEIIGWEDAKPERRNGAGGRSPNKEQGKEVERLTEILGEEYRAGVREKEMALEKAKADLRAAKQKLTDHLRGR